jgi:hypothetical protein
MLLFLDGSKGQSLYSKTTQSCFFFIDILSVRGYRGSPTKYRTVTRIKSLRHQLPWEGEMRKDWIGNKMLVLNPTVSYMRKQ